MSVIRDFQVSQFFPSKVGGATGTLYFPRVLGSSIGIQSVAPSATSAAGQLDYPGFNEVGGQVLDIIVAGNYNVAAGNVTINLSANTGTVGTPSYTIIASTGAVATAAVNQPFLLKATVQGDGVSGFLQGYQNSVMNNVAAAQSALTNKLTGINFAGGTSSTGVPGLPFGLVVSIVQGTPGANNVAQLTQFQIVGA